MNDPGALRSSTDSVFCSPSATSAVMTRALLEKEFGCATVAPLSVTTPLLTVFWPRSPLTMVSTYAPGVAVNVSRSVRGLPFEQSNRLKYGTASADDFINVPLVNFHTVQLSVTPPLASTSGLEDD